MNIKTSGKKILEQATRLGSPARTLARRAGSWWLRQHRRFGLVWRVGNALAAVLILASILAPVLSQLSQSNRYKLTASTLNMVGLTDPTLTDQLTYDGQTRTYEFNKAAVQQTSGNPLSNLQAQVGTASGQGNSKSLYALDVPQDLSRGVTYHDVNSRLSFSLVPEFSAGEGQEEQGHLVFPLSSGSQAVYTLKNNGLKEDIVVQKATSDTMTFSYRLDLPKTLEAKVIPNSNGELGIYSADPTLFGNITYGTSADEAAVEKARENSPKTYLVFGLPAPVVKTANGTPAGVFSRFQLEGDRLSVIASGLNNLKDPFSIDPSVVVSSASDFQSGNNESNIDFSTAGQIARSGLTGGGVGGTWSSVNLPTYEYGLCSVATNGYLYIISGKDDTGTYIPGVSYAAINANGSLGSWQTGGNLNTPRSGAGCAVYNNYIYVIAGYDGTTNVATAEYASINTSTGQPSAWQYTTSLPYSIGSSQAQAYNGYIYELGGSTSTGTYTSHVEYAPLNANGTIGTWVASPQEFSQGRDSFGSALYNGCLYVMGGNESGYIGYDVQYTHINDDGSVTAWQSTTTMLNGGRYSFQAVAGNGYLYAIGGNNGSYLAGVDYAPIYANGAIGNWSSTTAMPNAATSFTAKFYNGYLYAIGGSNSTQYLNQATYAKIGPAGIESNWQATTGIPTTNVKGKDYGVYGQTTIAYNGYLYDIGGSPIGGASPTPTAAVYYAAINADGTIGSWLPTTSLPAARFYQAGTIANGRIYLLGGWSAATSASTNDVLYISINGDGTLGSSWTSNTNKFTNVRASLSATTYNGYLYVLGGYQGATEYNDVQYAPINNSTGAVGAFTSAASFATGRDSLYAGVVGGYLYVVGGWNGATTYKDVQFAKLLPGGGLAGGLGSCPSGGTLTNATWCTTSSMQTTRYGLTGYTYNGCIYAVGGMNGTQSNTTEYACVNSNGTLSSWQSGTSFSSGRYYAGGDIYNGVMYLIGGANSSGPSYSDVQYASINNGGSGTLGGWQETQALKDGGVEQGATIAYNGYMYQLGGYNPSVQCYQTVQYAPIQGGGTLGSWQDTTGFSLCIEDSPGLVAYNNHLYVIGGSNGGGAVSAVWTNTINADGTLGSSWVPATALPQPRAAPAVTQYDGYIYVMGGSAGSESSAACGSSSDCQTTVYYAHIKSDGTLDSWNTATNLTTGRAESEAIAYGGYLYILGGLNTGYLNDVSYAPIGANGVLGSWAQTSSFNGVRTGMVAYAYDGYIYMAAGKTIGGPASDVQYAPISANGTLGQWTITSSLPVSRYYSGSAAYDGYLYFVSGATDSTHAYANVYYAPVNSMARSARYSKLIDLGAATNVSSVTYSGGVPGDASAITYRAAGSNGVFGAQIASTALSGDSSCNASSNYIRYILVSVTLDDSYGQSTAGGFPDSTVTPANLTDFTINYNPVHPPPNIRMRMGQTLQQGNLSALDTCVATVASSPAPVVASIGTPGNRYGGSGGISVGVPSGVASGSLVVAFIWLNSGGGTPDISWITPPTGAGTWTAAGSTVVTGCGGSPCLAAWFYKYATAADTGSYAFNFSNGPQAAAGYAMRITGGKTSGNPFSDTLQSASGTTTATVASFTPGGNNSLLLAGVGEGAFQGTFTPPSGWSFNAQYSTNQVWGVGVASATQTTAAATGSLPFSSSVSGKTFVLIGTLRGP